jgi:hypothetical protein
MPGQVRFCNAIATTLRGELVSRHASGAVERCDSCRLSRAVACGAGLNLAVAEAAPASAFDGRVYDRLCAAAIKAGSRLCAENELCASVVRAALGFLELRRYNAL